MRHDDDGLARMGRDDVEQRRQGPSRDGEPVSPPAGRTCRDSVPTGRTPRRAFARPRSGSSPPSDRARSRAGSPWPRPAGRRLGEDGGGPHGTAERRRVHRRHVRVSQAQTQPTSLLAAHCRERDVRRAGEPVFSGQFGRAVADEEHARLHRPAATAGSAAADAAPTRSGLLELIRISPSAASSEPLTPVTAATGSRAPRAGPTRSDGAGRAAACSHPPPASPGCSRSIRSRRRTRRASGFAP